MWTFNENKQISVAGNLIDTCTMNESTENPTLYSPKNIEVSDIIKTSIKLDVCSIISSYLILF